MMHGPLLFELNALAYLLFGASDFTARLVPALLGTAIIGMPYFLRHELGRAGAIAASLLLVISPAFLYFSRFIRHDIYVDAFTLLMVIGVFRYLATGSRSWFYTACVSAALLFATKEDFYISGFILFAVPGRQLVPAQRRAALAVPLARARPRCPVVGHRCHDVPGHQPAAVHDVPHQPAGRVYGARQPAAERSVPVPRAL